MAELLMALPRMVWRGSLYPHVSRVQHRVLREIRVSRKVLDLVNLVEPWA